MVLPNQDRLRLHHHHLRLPLRQLPRIRPEFLQALATQDCKSELMVSIHNLPAGRADGWKHMCLVRLRRIHPYDLHGMHLIDLKHAVISIFTCTYLASNAGRRAPEQVTACRAVSVYSLSFFINMQLSGSHIKKMHAREFSTSCKAQHIRLS